MSSIEPLPGRRRYQVAEPKEIVARTPPHNIEAEQALLGALLVNNDAFDRVSDFLRAEHFSEELHARIFEVVRAVDSRRQARHRRDPQNLSGRHGSARGNHYSRHISRGLPPRPRQSSTPRITAAPSMISRCVAI